MLSGRRFWPDTINLSSRISLLSCATSHKNKSRLAPGLRVAYFFVAALNRKTDDIPVMLADKMNLFYKSSSQMTGNTSVDSKFNNCKVLVSAQSVSGTPYTGSNLWNVTGIVSDGKLTIDAWGAGFVSGHVLSVSYLLVV